VTSVLYQRSWLAKLGFPTNPPALRLYLGDPPPPPDVLDRPLAWEGTPGTIRTLLPSLCLKGQPDLAARAGRLLCTAIAAEEVLDAVRLLNRVKVPWGWSRLCLGLHLLAAAGSGIVPALRAELERQAREGLPRYWSGDNLCIDNSTGIQCWVALHHLSPAERPEVKFDPVYTRMLVQQGDELGADAKAWISEAFAVIGLSA
jgi:hypothetical protein